MSAGSGFDIFSVILVKDVADGGADAEIGVAVEVGQRGAHRPLGDRKSTRLNSSH